MSGDSEAVGVGGGDTEVDVSEEQNAVSEWNDLTVAQLKEELQERGLEITGRKADLVARLVASDKELIIKMNEEQQPTDNGNGETAVEGEESEFVVWNDEHDTDKLLDEAGTTADDEDEGNAAEVSQEQEQEEAAAAAGGEEEKEKEGEKDVVAEVLKADDFDKEVEYGAKVASNKDQLLMTWRHHKIKVPFKEESAKELRLFTKKQNIIMYSIELSDIYSDVFRRHIEVATNISMEMDETIPGSPPKGYLRLKFGSVAEAETAMDEIKDYRKQQEREINMRTFSDHDSEGEVLSHVKKEDASKRDPLVHRLLFVGNLPSEVTEAALKDHFIGVLRVFLSRTEDSQEHNGYAYLEYRSEAEAMEMATQYRDTELYGQMLYVIKCLTQRKASFGLLKDSLRKYWLEQLANLETTKAKTVTRTPREIAELDAKLLRLKRRIDKDNQVRESINLPVPENEKFGTTDADSEKEKGKDEEGGGSKRDDRKSSEKKSTPPRRRHSPSSSSSAYRGSSYRGGYSSRGPSRGPSSRYMGSSGRGGGSYVRGGGRDNANVLVNQLQELVGVLATRVPEAASALRSSGGGGGSSMGYSSRGHPPSHDNYGGSYRGSSAGSRYPSSGKRPHDDDYPMERKRRIDDGSSYYGGGGGGSRDRGGYGSSYGGSSRRGGRGYY